MTFDLKGKWCGSGGWWVSRRLQGGCWRARDACALSQRRPPDFRAYDSLPRLTSSIRRVRRAAASGRSITAVPRPAPFLNHRQQPYRWQIDVPTWVHHTICRMHGFTVHLQICVPHSVRSYWIEFILTIIQIAKSATSMKQHTSQTWLRSILATQCSVFHPALLDWVPWWLMITPMAKWATWVPKSTASSHAWLHNKLAIRCSIFVPALLDWISRWNFNPDMYSSFFLRWNWTTWNYVASVYF